ncbi:MAG: ATP-binding cassette domain-containing protein [Deltaproteobacteria bacterium]|nr:ATP-binding cassette domain-containing protein [Deltaproteobacteria bacterium]
MNTQSLNFAKFTLNSANIILAARSLQKTFGSRQAVRGIDLDIYQGECFGFLGPNGAGKTTTIQMIIGLAEKTAGDLRVFGLSVPQDLVKIKRRIGVVPQNDNLDPDLTVLENLLIYASYYGITAKHIRPRVDELLRFFALDNRRDEIIQHLSGGQRRRLLLARALVHQPELLILDEPTVGLDPQARYLIWQRLRQLQKNGLTMLLTSHYMDEVSRLASRVVIMDQGLIVAQGKPQQMIDDMVGADVFEVICDEREARMLAGVAAACQARAEIMADGIFIYTRNACSRLDSEIRSLPQWLRRPANLEDLFIKLTGRSLRES